MNPRSKYVVLDKSFLVGLPGRRICELCIDHKVIMSWPLFYELMTGDPTQRAECFAKLPKTNKPIALCQNIGYLMGREVKSGQAISPITEAFVKDAFSFNPNLIDPNYMLNEKHQIELDERKAETSMDIDRFIQRLPTVTVWFPELRNIAVGSELSIIQPFVDRICKSNKNVKEIYTMIRSNDFPPVELLNEGWFLYKWVQVQVLAGIDYIRRYGLTTDSINRINAEHTYWDLENCVIASLAGALASKDKAQIWYFQRLYPSGLVIQD